MSRPEKQRGSVMAEAAIALSVLTLLAFGLLELARTGWSTHAALQAATEAARLAARCGHGPLQQAHIRDRLRPLLEASGQLRLGQRDDWLSLNPLPQGCDVGQCTHVQARLQGLTVDLGPGVIPLTLDISPPLATAVREGWGQLPSAVLTCTT